HVVHSLMIVVLLFKVAPRSEVSFLPLLRQGSSMPVSSESGAGCAPLSGAGQFRGFLMLTGCAGPGSASASPSPPGSPGEPEAAPVPPTMPGSACCSDCAPDCSPD